MNCKSIKITMQGDALFVFSWLMLYASGEVIFQANWTFFGFKMCSYISKFAYASLPECLGSSIFQHVSKALANCHQEDHRKIYFVLSPARDFVSLLWSSPNTIPIFFPCKHILIWNSSVDYIASKESPLRRLYLKDYFSVIRFRRNIYLNAIHRTVFFSIKTTWNAWMDHVWLEYLHNRTESNYFK